MDERHRPAPCAAEHAGRSIEPPGGDVLAGYCCEEVARATAEFEDGWLEVGDDCLPPQKPVATRYTHGHDVVEWRTFVVQAVKQPCLDRS